MHNNLRKRTIYDILEDDDRGMFNMGEFLNLCESGYFADKAGIPNMFDPENKGDESLSREDIRKAMIAINSSK